MDEKEDRLPLIGQSWNDIVTSTFTEDTPVVVKDELSEWYLIGGFVTSVDIETYEVGVFLPDSGLLRRFRPSQLRVVKS